MNMGDLPTWIASGIAFVVGVLGIVFGALGYTQAKKSNRIASDAAKAAAAANGIAEEANQLSQEANTLAARSVALQEEDWFVDWRPRWDARLAILTLTNTGSDVALDTAVTVSAPDLHFDTGQMGDVGPASMLSVPISEVATLRSVHDAERLAAQRSMQAAGYFINEVEYQIQLKVTVRWKTGLGFPKSDELQVEAR